ncbi:MAG TPA: LysR substrate-binding domain-containing protein [Candidatus Acidoferrales bacterium]|nr:LysR substrate-binding domain-containing protein [Candidatus Acidoferrales bacterium]
MELRHLRYFIATAEEENVSLAASKLHVSQPAISRQIHDLEDEIGFQLFERSAKSLKLTEAGRAFLTDAKALLRNADGAVKNARAIASGALGELHVGYSPSLTAKILPASLRAFKARFPNVRVALHDVSGEEMLAGLRQDKLHVAFTAASGKKPPAGMKSKELLQDAICVAVPTGHALAEAKTVTLERLLKESLIAFSRADYPGYLELIEDTFTQFKRVPHIAEEHDGISSVLTAVEAGRGIALVGEQAGSLSNSRVKIIPIAGVPRVSVVALWNKDSTSPFIEKFVGIVADTAAK